MLRNAGKAKRVVCNMNIESSLLGVGRHKEEKRVGRSIVEKNHKNKFEERRNET